MQGLAVNRRQCRNVDREIDAGKSPKLVGNQLPPNWSAFAVLSRRSLWMPREAEE